MSYVVNLYVKGILVTTFGPFSDYKEAKIFARNNRNKAIEKYGLSVGFYVTEVFSTFEDFEEID